MSSANMNLEAGMLAMVVGYNYEPYNVGKIVTLVSFHKRGDSIPYTDGARVAASDVWLVKGDDLMRMLKRTMTGETLKSIGAEAIFSPSHLMPIRPDEDPLEIEVEKTNVAMA